MAALGWRAGFIANVCKSGLSMTLSKPFPAVG
jgi:hypothetical protein